MAFKSLDKGKKMVCDKVLYRIGWLGALMLMAGVVTAVSTLAAFAGSYTAVAVALMAMGVVCAALGYAFLILAYRLKKRDNHGEGAEKSAHCLSLG